MDGPVKPGQGEQKQMRSKDHLFDDVLIRFATEKSSCYVLDDAGGAAHLTLTMSIASVEPELSRTAKIPLLSPLISRCFRSVIAAVMSLLFGPETRRKNLILRIFPDSLFSVEQRRPAVPGGTADPSRASENLFNRRHRTHYDGPMPFAADMPPLPARAHALIDFWFGPADHPERLHHKQIWFRSTPEFDEAVRENFAADHHDAVAGRLHEWEAEPLSALALVMLLDQVPRNIFRSTPRAFASDALALATTRRAMERSFDQAVPAAWRLFFYLPFEHSEVLEHQQHGLDLLLALPPVPGRRSDGHMTRLHLEIIERFGRFPHRNAILGRPSTEEELAFLIECEHRFGQPAPPSEP